MSSPPIGVVIPVFKHSNLVNDAIFSALDQDIAQGVHVVVVNDGCPHEETDQVLFQHHLADPDRVAHVTRPNGGLSAARNTGIRWLLQRYPDIQAIYMLDADNIIEPGALRRAYDALVECPDYGWVYPDIDMFGFAWHGDYGGKYSLLQHIQRNICEAGSLVSASVFKKGVMFDESMRLGYEDWDFFLSAAEAGFVGRHLPDFGFRYRKRAESMVTDSHRDDDEIRGYLQRKHRKLFHPRNRVNLEQVEAPRYAILDSDTGQANLTTDPADVGELINMDEFVRRYWASRLDPSQPFPTFVVASSRRVTKTLEDAKLLRWAYWRVENIVRLERLGAVGFQPATSADDPAIEFSTYRSEGSELIRANSQLVMIHISLLDEIVNDKSSDWINSVVATDPRPSFSTISIKISGQSGEYPAFDNWWGMLRCIHLLRSSVFAAAKGIPASWKEAGCIPIRHLALAPWHRDAPNAALLPMIDNGRQSVAFLLPLFDFGGVEKVAKQVAAELTRRGIDCHLVIAGTQRLKAPVEALACFKSISFADLPEIDGWAPYDEFMGSTKPRWANAWEQHPYLIGLLACFDAVVFGHTYGAVAIAGKLKRLGITTVNHLHVADMSMMGRPTGHPHVAIAYEHSFDAIATCSNRLADWCRGMGVPKEKVIPIPNAEGSDFDRILAGKIAKGRTQRLKSSPLNVLFLGRLDRQKGMERIFHFAQRAEALGLNIKVRAVGSKILDAALGEEARASGAIEFRPAIHGTPSLVEQFKWADVMLLPSHWEGLPLSIIEAQLHGVVPVATDVGAVSEVIEHGQNGFLLSNNETTADMLKVIASLALDRTLLHRVANAAHTSAMQRSWSASVAPLYELLIQRYSKSLFAIGTRAAD